MASITKQRIGKYTYLYESVSYRDELGRPRNKKTKIGKIDTDTGGTIYTPEYRKRTEVSYAQPNILESEEIPVEARKYAREFLDSVKCYGVHWFLRKISEKIGLWDILQQAFPEIWQEIFTLACYLIVSDKPAMYCEDWLAENEWLEVGSMSSQRISELFTKFDETHRYQFYRIWSKHIQEQEYLALDITSISSYSEQIADCEWGHNRDNEKLPQVNLCMLYGEESRLPVFQTNYSGSLSDVTTLESTISEFHAVAGEREIMAVMDKGFYSTQNVNLLIKHGVRFLVSMSFAGNLAKQLVANERNDIDQISNVIHTSGAPIRGIHRDCDWPQSDHKLHAHIYFNPEKAVKERNELYGHVAKLKDIAKNDSDNTKYKKDIAHYLAVQKADTAQGSIAFQVREDIVAKTLETVGWFVLLSNHIDDPQSAYDVYRLKDVVEKSFWKYKNSLGLDRLRVHTDERALNKTFIAFISLILSSHIHNVLKIHQLYKTITFDKLFLILAKLKSASIAGHRFLRPLTKQVKDIFRIFQIPSPVG